jgi:multiple sugar transport system permease protein
MASRDVVHYDTPLQRILRGLAVIFVVFYLIWTLLPFVVMFVSSFKDLLEAFKLPEVGDWLGVGVFFEFTPTLKHYQTLFYENNFSRYIANSLIAAGGSAVISVIFGSLAAYSLSRVEFKGKADLFFWIISTRMAPVVAVMVPLFAIFRSLDLVGTLPGLILAYTTFNLPFAIWILKGFFDNVPYGIEEAQMVDGATRFQAFRSILPLVAPGIGAFLVLERLSVRRNHRLWRGQDPAGGHPRTGAAAEYPMGCDHGCRRGDHCPDDAVGSGDPQIPGHRPDHGCR